MALVKKTPCDGLQKIDTYYACGPDAMDIGLAYLHDGVKDAPAWPTGTNWEFHFSFGLDLCSVMSISKLIVFDNRNTDDWWTWHHCVSLWGSTDNVNYTYIQTYDPPTRTAGIWELVFSEAHRYRYFKVYCCLDSDGLWDGTGNWIQITELEAWGEEFIPKLSGTVKEKGSNVVRTVRSYIRSTGELFDTTVSAANGTFELEAPDTTSDMFVIAFDDDAGEQYNALVYDRVKGVL